MSHTVHHTPHTTPQSLSESPKYITVRCSNGFTGEIYTKNFIELSALLAELQRIFGLPNTVEKLFRAYDLITKNRVRPGEDYTAGSTAVELRVQDDPNFGRVPDMFNSWKYNAITNIIYPVIMLNSINLFDYNFTDLKAAIILALGEGLVLDFQVVKLEGKESFLAIFGNDVDQLKSTLLPLVPIAIKRQLRIIDRGTDLLWVSGFNAFGESSGYIRDIMCANETLILKTVQRHPFHFKDFPETSLTEEVIMIVANKIGLHVLTDGLEYFRYNTRVVMNAVQKHGYNLKYALGACRADKGVVLAAVNQCGVALEHASGDLRADKEVVLAAVNQDGVALRYASAELMADSEIVLSALICIANYNCSSLTLDAVTRMQLFYSQEIIHLSSEEIRQPLLDKLAEFRQNIGVFKQYCESELAAIRSQQLPTSSDEQQVSRTPKP